MSLGSELDSSGEMEPHTALEAARLGVAVVRYMVAGYVIAINNTTHTDSTQDTRRIRLAVLKYPIYRSGVKSKNN